MSSRILRPNWDLLGVTKTTDEKSVKRAYAKQLKKISLSNDSHKFQELRVAYEAAIQYCKYSIQKDSSKSKFEKNERVSDYAADYMDALVKEGEEAAIDKFKSWKQQGCFERLDSMEIFEHRLIGMLMSYGYLADKTIVFFDEEFGWSEKKDNVYYHNSNLYRYIFYMLKIVKLLYKIKSIADTPTPFFILKYKHDMKKAVQLFLSPPPRKKPRLSSPIKKNLYELVVEFSFIIDRQVKSSLYDIEALKYWKTYFNNKRTKPIKKKSRSVKYACIYFLIMIFFGLLVVAFQHGSQNEDSNYNQIKRQTALGLNYLYGYNHYKKNYKLAKKWLILAANQGDLTAQSNLAWLYEIAPGEMKNLSKAFYWYMKAALSGDSYAQVALGDFYYNGVAVNKNYKLAKYWYQKAIKHGNADAMNMLGVMYQNGLGVQPDIMTASDLYSRAIKSGSDAALFNLAMINYNGMGYYKKNKKLAFSLLKRAAAKDQKDAIKFLLIHYNWQPGESDKSNHDLTPAN